jgi:hypothetical protein
MYDDMPCPGRSVRNVLELFGKIEWGRGGVIIENDNDWNYPPVVVWRYKHQDERRDQLIVNAVESFKGKLEWKITFRDRRETLGGRNWSIMPQQLYDFPENVENIQEFLDSMGALSLDGAFAILHPEIGLAANQELPQLAEHIRKTVAEALNQVA